MVKCPTQCLSTPLAYHTPADDALSVTGSEHARSSSVPYSAMLDTCMVGTTHINHHGPEPHV